MKIEKLVNEIESEMAICDNEIASCRRQRAAIDEREKCIEDKKTMLFALLEKANEMMEDKKNG